MIGTDEKTVPIVLFEFGVWVLTIVCVPSGPSSYENVEFTHRYGVEITIVPFAAEGPGVIVEVIVSVPPGPPSYPVFEITKLSGGSSRTVPVESGGPGVIMLVSTLTVWMVVSKFEVMVTYGYGELITTADPPVAKAGIVSVVLVRAAGPPSNLRNLVA